MPAASARTFVVPRSACRSCRVAHCRRGGFLRCWLQHAAAPNIYRGSDGRRSRFASVKAGPSRPRNASVPRSWLNQSGEIIPDDRVSELGFAHVRGQLRRDHELVVQSAPAGRPIKPCGFCLDVSMRAGEARSDDCFSVVVLNDAPGLWHRGSGFTGVVSQSDNGLDRSVAHRLLY